MIPFFRENPLRTSKQHDFVLFCEVVEMMRNRYHLTLEGLEKIRELKNPQRLYAELRSYRGRYSPNSLATERLMDYKDL